MQLRPYLLSALALLAVSGATEDTTLEADRLSVSLAQGGTQILSIDLGLDNAGKRYLIAGSSTGTFPGTLRDNVRVPLNFDAYSEQVLERTNSSNFSSFSGVLDKQGKAEARLTMPPTQKGSLAGKVFHHAVVVMDPKTGTVLATSNPVEVLLLP